MHLNSNACSKIDVMYLTGKLLYLNQSRNFLLTPAIMEDGGKCNRMKNTFA